MEHFGRWLAQNSEKRAGSNRQVLAFFSSFGVLMSPILTVSAYYDNLPIAMWGSAAFGVVAACGWIPYLKFKKENRHQERYREEFKRIAGLHASGKLAEELGPRATNLEGGARDWEAVVLLAERKTLEEELSRQVTEEANARMDRIVDMTIAPPAFFGLTVEGAEAQIAEDVRWLADARKALEDATLTGESLARLAEDPLHRLRSLANERSAALAELKA